MTTLLPRPDSLGSAGLAASAGAGLRKSHSASVSATAPAPPSFAMLPSRLRRVTVMGASRASHEPATYRVLAPVARTVRAGLSWRRPVTTRRTGFEEER